LWKMIACHHSRVHPGNPGTKQPGQACAGAGRMPLGG
jgi:hypothetical protein